MASSAWRTARTGVVAAALAVCACSSLPVVGGRDEPGLATPSSLGPEAAAAYQGALRSALSGAAGGPETFAAAGVSGAVTAGETRVLGVLDERSAAVVAPGGLVVGYEMEIDQGPVVTPSSANIRLGPFADARRAGQTEAGRAYVGFGRLLDRDWILLGEPGRVLGYVYAPLVTSAPGTGLRLAGAPVRTPVLCRSYTARIDGRRGGARDGEACTEDGRTWRE